MYLADARETHLAGMAIAEKLERGSVLGLIGDLGAGKTTLVRGIAEGLGVRSLREVTSPSYALIHDYPAEAGTLVHMDFYRLEGPEAAVGLGIEDYLERSDVWVVIEWPSRLAELLPERIRYLEMTVEGDGRRLEWRDGEKPARG